MHANALLLLLLHFPCSRTVRATRHKRPIRVLAPALSRVWGFDAVGPNPLVLPTPAPEEGPAIVIHVRHLAARGRRAGVGTACPVGCAVRRVVLVVRHEDGERLRLGRPGVVGTLGGLDRRRDLGRWERG